MLQVEGRDEEIERLTNMLDGGRPSDVVALEAKNRSNERMISHLNIQVCCSLHHVVSHHFALILGWDEVHG